MTLDRLVDIASPLLTRVDTVLRTSGAPAGHPVWAELRRVRLLPGDAVSAVAALRPADLLEAPRELQIAADTCATLADSLPGPEDWTGEAADAYDRSRRTLATKVSGAPGGLDARLHATAELATSLINWMHTTQATVANIVADALASAEAVIMADSTAIPASNREIEAAANVAAQILEAVADAYDHAADLLQDARALTR